MKHCWIRDGFPFIFSRTCVLMTPIGIEMWK